MLLHKDFHPFVSTFPGPSPPVPQRRPPAPAPEAVVEANKPATPPRLNRGRPGRGILVKSMTFTAKGGLISESVSVWLKSQKNGAKSYP